jgi:hypothetical protein
MTEILLRNVRVNAIADYYDIPQLKQLANTKIQHVLETSWSADGFSNIVKEVFNSTSVMALHNIMTLTAATHIEELLKLEDFALLELMSDFSIGLMRNTRLRRTFLLRNFKLSNLSYNTQNPAFNPPSRIARMRSHCVAARLPGLIALSKTLTIVSMLFPRPVLVAMSVARPTLPVISSAAVLQMSPTTRFIAQGADADIKVLDRGWWFGSPQALQQH